MEPDSRSDTGHPLTLMRGTRIGTWGTAALALIALVFLALPLIALIIRAVANPALDSVSTDALLDAINLSAVSTFATLILTLLFGTPLAYVLARWRFPLRGLVSVLVQLPIVLPPAVAGLALLIAFGRRGVFGTALDSVGITLPFTLYAVILAQTFVAAPFYVRSAQVGFASIPRELEDAGRVDGAGGWRLFRYITLPLTFRALSAGLILCWARALGEFGATVLFAGSLQGRTQTMPLLIYNIIERDINAAVWAGLILIGLALAALLMAQAIMHGAEENADGS